MVMRLRVQCVRLVCCAAAFAALNLVPAACAAEGEGEGEGEGEAGCAGLCTGAGFDDGTEEDFGDVVECLCAGDGDGIVQADCDAYCAGVDISTAFVTSEVGTNDKCVCDGTQG